MNNLLDKLKNVQYNYVEVKEIMIYREHYIKNIRGFYDSDLIKIIVGIRRCRKVDYIRTNKR